MTTIQCTDRWKSGRLATLFAGNAEKNSNLSSTEALQFRYGEIRPKPIYDLTDDLKETYKKYALVRPNDIMLNGLNLNYDFVTQRVAQVKSNGIITSAYISLRPREGVSAKYYTYLLKTLDSMKVFNGMGTGIRLTLSYNLLRNLELPIPQHEEQDQIVRYLDWQVSKINKLIAAKKKQIAVLKENNLTELYHVMTNGLRHDNLSIQTNGRWIVSVPTHWKIVAVRRNYSSILGKMLATVPKDDGDTQEKYFCAKDVHFNTASKNDLKMMWFSSAEKEMYRVSEGDLLIVEGGAGAGGAAIVDISQDESIYIQNSIHRVRPKSRNASNRFLCYWMYCLQKRGYIDYICNVATIPHFTKEKLLMTEMPFPPYAEQLEIVYYLDNLFARLDTTVGSLVKEIESLHELRTRLISDVVTGQIDVRGIEVPNFDIVEEIDSDEETLDDEDATEETEEQEAE